MTDPAAGLDAPWDPLFTTAAGAAAALAGLLIVAVSVNVRVVVATPVVAARAGTSVGALVLILIVSCLALVPGLPAGASVVVGGVLAAFVASIANAWVVLVEVLR
jgi:hypothetical protein